MSISNREIYEGEHLKADDFISGIGFDNSLLCKLRELRPTVYNEHNYHIKTFTAIDGTVKNKKYHPLLGKVLIDKRKDEDGLGGNRHLIIESVHRHWYFGTYWTIVYRMAGTKSHGTLSYKNENCINSVILEEIESVKSNVTFKDKTLSWEQF